MHIPLRHDLARELDAAARQGIELRFVFAADAPGYALLRKQGGRAITRLQGRGAATLDFVAGADHTFTRADARERLLQILDQRMWPGRGMGNDAA